MDFFELSVEPGEARKQGTHDPFTPKNIYQALQVVKGDVNEFLQTDLVKDDINEIFRLMKEKGYLLGTTQSLNEID